MISSVPISWNQAKEVIRTNALGDLYRDQHTTDKYRQFRQQCDANGESVVQYIIKNRLRWTTDGVIDTTPTSSRLFAHENDVCFIPNDFPYKFEAGVTHLVVWSKLAIPCDPESSIGDVSPATRRVIETYVHRNFVQQMGLPRENVVWFRNFPALQSVVELSHVHVLVKDLSDDFYQAILDTAGTLLSEAEVDEIMAQNNHEAV